MTETTFIDFSQKPDYSKYDHVIVACSFGKDSIASGLDLIEDGCPIEKIEFWHHDVDGREGSAMMDWPVTRDYGRVLAEAIGVPLYFSWLEGGIEREMLRNDTPKAPTHWENPDGTIGTSGGKGPLGTRLKFPQVCADLKKRWCSAYAKIDVMDTAIANQKRFDGKMILVVTGERAEESANRAKYKQYEPHRKDCKKRTIHQWRPVHDWSEAKVWEIIERHNIAPHPAYYLGWGRLSCMTCIFGSKDQWASVKAIDEEKFEKIADYEEDFGLTIQRKCSVRELANDGNAYADMSAGYVAQAMSEKYYMRINPLAWEMPTGAFGESCGPN